MAIEARVLRRPSERGLYLTAAVGFPLLVLIGYFKSYYFASFFADAPPIANRLVHAHGLVMTLWVAFFAAQIALVRSRSVKLHMRMGWAGVALALLVIVVGLATAYDAQLVRRAAPPGADPHEFFILPVGDMLLFAVFFAAAVYYRRRPAEHKSLMLMTAINFLPAALFRIPLVPADFQLPFAFLTPALIGLVYLYWMRKKHGHFNRVCAAALFVYTVCLPLRLYLAETALWHDFVRTLI